MVLEVQRKLLGLQKGCKVITHKRCSLSLTPNPSYSHWFLSCCLSWDLPPCLLSFLHYRLLNSSKYEPKLHSSVVRHLKSYSLILDFEEGSFLLSACPIAFFREKDIWNLSPPSGKRLLFYGFHHFVISSGISRDLASFPFLIFSWSQIDTPRQWKIFPRLFYDFWIAECTRRCLLSLHLIKNNALFIS